MNFDIITLNQNMEIMQDYAIWILVALLFKLKLKIFIKILQMMLMNGLIHLSMMKMIKGHFQLVKIKK